MDLFVARQPIFDKNLNVVAYEVLYRSGATNAFDGTDARTATAKVINAVFYSPGGVSLLGGHPAFVNFPESLLLEDVAMLLPQDTVIEILETVEPTEKIIAACQRLRQNKYTLALDDFIDMDGDHPLAQYAQIIKVDIKQTSRKECERIARHYRNKILLAEKLEEEQDFHWAVQQGFSRFQGYFFARPHISAVPQMLGFRMNCLEILKRINMPELNLAALAHLVECEPGISYKILRLANSALVGRRGNVTSVHQAMLRIGEQEVRKWLSLIVTLDLTSERPSELIRSAVLRGRFCELLGEEAGFRSGTNELFLIGLFSHLDAMFCRPLEELLAELNLSPEICQTLLEPCSDRNLTSQLWSTVLAYEAANWETVESLLTKAGLTPDQARLAYANAVTWADNALHR
jgi:c-di-GMP-related signal transduction protein